MVFCKTITISKNYNAYLSTHERKIVINLLLHWKLQKSIDADKTNKKGNDEQEQNI